MAFPRVGGRKRMWEVGLIMPAVLLSELISTAALISSSWAGVPIGRSALQLQSAKFKSATRARIADRQVHRFGFLGATRMSGGSEFFSSVSDGASSLTSDTLDEAAVELATATAVSDKAAAAVRVVTYNVLSSSLCQADYHVKCDANNLDAWVRLRRVCDLLEPEVGMKSIICLQEVSTLWAGHLHAFFSRRDYHMIHMGYGGKFDGYMGCAIAFPTSKYVLESCKIDRVADLKKWPKLEPPGRRQRLKNWLDGLLRQWKGERAPVDPYQDTKKRANQMIMTRLQDKESLVAFCLATYHMPCQFRVPEVMVSHAALALRHLQRVARADPLIFCGDFNFKPGDAAYRLVTEGRLSPTDTSYPTMPATDRWEPKVEYAMQSAYFLVNRQEPEYTDWSYTKGSEEDFVGCLDYIFVSTGVAVEAVGKLPTKEFSPGPYPSATQPSDHVMLAADVLISPNANELGASLSGGRGKRGKKTDEEAANEFRSAILEFVADTNKDKMDFPSSLSSFERLTIHRIAEEVELLSGSSGAGRDRKISIWKK